MKTKKFVLLLLVCLLMGASLTSCAPQADFDIRGEWEYTMTAADGNTYDIGTITFSGDPAKGTYAQVNIYQVEYEGEYAVNGSALNLTGDETWQGALTSADQMSGTWSHGNEASGTFTAKRKQ